MNDSWLCRLILCWHIVIPFAIIPSALQADPSLDALLDAAEQELRKKPKSSLNRLPSVKTDSAKEVEKADPSTSPLPKKERASAELIEILSLEKAAASQETRAVEPILEVKVAAGMMKLGDYRLEKDDDTFHASSNDWAKGGILSMIPYTHKVGQSSFTFSLLMSLAYFQFDMDVRREGVVEEDNKYQHNVFDVALGPMLGWNSGYGKLLTYAVFGITTTEQDSSSASESIMHMGPHSSLGIGYAVTPFQWPAAFTVDYIMRLSGFGGAAGPASGQTVALGVNLAIRG